MKRWRPSRLTPLTLHPARSEPGGLCNHAHLRWDFTPLLSAEYRCTPRSRCYTLWHAGERGGEQRKMQRCLFAACGFIKTEPLLLDASRYARLFSGGRTQRKKHDDPKTPEFCPQVIMGCQTRTLDWRRSSVHRSEIQSERVDHGCFPQSVKWSLVTCDAVHLCREAPPSEYKGCGARCSGDACLRSCVTSVFVRIR